MKIYSWNMLFKNQNLDEALAWINHLDFDVLCLQEVPEAFLPCLTALPFHVAYACEGNRRFPKQSISAYVAIISRYPFINTITYTLPDAPTTLLSRVFMRCMRWAFIQNRNALFVDVMLPGHTAPTRIGTVHISLSTPQTRANELLSTFAKLEKKSSMILCGDFNIIESFRCAPLNTILGGPWLDTFDRHKERRTVEKMYAEQELTNPLRGLVTHPVAHSQLDHILLSNDFVVTSKGVSNRRFGSDHRPVWVTTA